MPTLINFRPHHADDQCELEAMVLALYQADASDEGMSVQKIRRTVDEFRRHPEKGCIIVFATAASVVGYAIICYFWSNEYGGNIIIIDELFVKPDWQGHGIGTAFFQYLLANEDVEVKGLLLEVTPKNDRAFAFYTRLGFATAKNRHLFMKRTHE